MAPLERRYHLVCAAAAVAQIVTVRWTWKLWSQRSDPPNLPVVEWLSSFSWGPLLVLLCIATAVRPRWGGPAFAIALALACLGDQMRLQPGVVSVAVLMVAPAFGQGGRSIARWYLCSLWLWAGLHKLLSLGWIEGNAVFIAESLGRVEWSGIVAVVVPLSEIGLGLTAMWPRLWKVTAVGAVLLHVGVLLTLSPLFGNWNSSVWPWNAAVAVVAPVLFLSQREGAAFGGSRAVVAVAAGLLAYPALFYAGVVDAYVSHNLYTSNVARAQICEGDECSDDALNTWDELNVPLPPEPRLYRQAFGIVCDSGDVLVITGRRTQLTGPPTTHTETCHRQ
ncbi:MAG TPA: hypothetical protein VHI10_09995 [Mycobacterium sp.]|nr:hypothetical protein [Mycobacterium sp.]